jgi:(2R)-ethylmalonyl-CoA mutase
MSEKQTKGDQGAKAGREKPWLMRTYSGHSSAKASNALYRTNLARGQTGLSVAFDLPTQAGYDSDHVLARGEVGKVGVPIGHVGDMMALFDGIPLGRMNTSMTINATAVWLFALYTAVAEKQGAARTSLQGTTQNDIIKEYLSRGTYVFPPGPSLRLTTDLISFCYREVPKWNPINVCSYHLQEAGATPVQEVAFTLANAIAVLDGVKASGQVPPADLPTVVGRISFFLNAGIRFITETCKIRAFTELWDEVTRERYGVADPALRRFRYGVQVNSLGLTEQQPENNAYRVLLEMLAVVLSKKARARSVQLPAWNEALGLPRPWDQQWSLRLQQIVAHETDLLDYDDIFDGSRAIEAKVGEIKAEAQAELDRVLALGGAVAGVETSYMKRKLVESATRRVDDIESGRLPVIGVNMFTESEPSPLVGGDAPSFLKVDPRVEEEQVERLRAWRASRDHKDVQRTLSELGAAAREGRNLVPASIACAHAGVTTGEWADALRAIFGEYRAPTGVGKAQGAVSADRLSAVRDRVEAVSARLGRRVKVLIGKPGLDGHSNGAEQIAVHARDAGMEVVYEGIRLTPAQIVNAALEEGVHLVGLSILSGSHLALVMDVVKRMRSEGLGHVPVVAGGIIPADDARQLTAAGVARVYTPKDFDLTAIMRDMVDLIDGKNKAA